MRLFQKPERFWTEITQIEGSATPYVLGRTLVFGAIALVITVVEELTDPTFSLSRPAHPVRDSRGRPGGLAGACGPMPATSGGGRRGSSGAESSTSAVISRSWPWPTDRTIRTGGSRFGGWIAAFAHVAQTQPARGADLTRAGTLDRDGQGRADRLRRPHAVGRRRRHRDPPPRGGRDARDGPVRLPPGPGGAVAAHRSHRRLRTHPQDPHADGLLHRDPPVRLRLPGLAPVRHPRARPAG